MINLFQTQIETLSLHKVGNKSRNEKMVLSASPYRLSDEITPLLKEYFFKPFREKEEKYFQFSHEVDLEYNEMYNCATAIFENPDNFHHCSQLITKHLFEQSNHPHIKNGEVYVVYLRNLEIDNHHVDGIGIFKSEIKSDFLDIKEVPGSEIGTKLIMQLKSGIALNKLDKGCIIFNHKKEEGYKIMTIDNNRYDTRYWLEHFLAVDAFHDENFLTRKYIKFCSDFGKNVVRPMDDTKEQCLFENSALNYFAKNDEFNEDNFIEQVVKEMPKGDELVEAFKLFRYEQSEKYNLENVTEFPISNAAVNDSRKHLNTKIKLDTNIEISMNFNNPESLTRFVEKGWDEEKQMYYYLVYFNKETK